MGERLRERIDVALPRRVTKGLRLHLHERPEGPRQGLSRRHLRVVDQDRDDDRPVPERRFDLEPDHVLVRAIQHATPGAVVDCRRPVGTDDREDDLGLLHAPNGVALPLVTGGDVAGVEEDILGAEPLLQRLGQLARSRLRIRAAIADENMQR